MVIFATSNFPKAIDPAFVSRLDMTFEIELPDATTIEAILRDALGEVGSDIDDEARLKASNAMAGMSGRDVRKIVFEAMISRDISTSVDAPLTEKQLWSAIDARRTQGDSAS